MSRKCLICGIAEPIDRAHLIPRHLLIGLIGLRKYAGFQIGNNIIYLCRNHHYLFDHFKLDEDGWKIVIRAFDRLDRALDMLLNSDIKPKNNIAKKQHDKYLKKFNKWKNNIAIYLCKYGRWQDLRE